jgi:hypothetical protein
VTSRKDTSGSRKRPQDGDKSAAKRDGAKPGRDASKPRDPSKPMRGTLPPGQVEPDPWRVPVAVEQVPETGVERHITANASELAAMAKVAGLRFVDNAKASMTLMPGRAGTFHIDGRVTARIGQTCVVSLEDMDTNLDEVIDIDFAPPSQIPTMASTIDDQAEDGEDIPDPPEPIIDGIIDIGRVATDALFLAIDPYPRKPDAVLELPIEEPDPEEHPFAALKVLKEGPQ